MQLDEIEIGDTELSAMLTSKHSPSDTVSLMSARRYHLDQDYLLELIDGLRTEGQLADVAFMVDAVKRLVVQHAAETLRSLAAEVDFDRRSAEA